MNNTQKIAVVTGGAHGIGKCIAEEFRKQGVKIYVIEVESEGGITQEQLDRISGIEEVRLVGKFRSVEKK